MASTIPSSTTILRTTASESKSHPTTVSSENQPIIPTVNPVLTKTNVPLIAPVPTQTTVPLVKPPTHAPVKMVSVPINSDIITQGNSQVVLIPVGGLDSMKLESALKVPEGQKLVIIKPQEILKTIEQKKSKKSQEPAQNLTMVQQGIMLQGINQGGFQQVPAGTTQLEPDKTGLVRLAPKTVAVTQSVNNASLLQGVQKASLSQHGLAQQFVSAAGVPRQKLQTYVTQTTPSKVSNPKLSSTIRLQNMASKVANSVTTVQHGVASKQETLLNTSVGGKTGTVQTKSATTSGVSHETSQVINSNFTTQQPSQIFNSSNHAQGSSTVANHTTSETSSTTSQADLTASGSCLPASKTSLTTSQTGLPTQQSDKKPNLYQTLKDKLKEENSIQSQASSSDVKQSEKVTQDVKTAGNAQSNVESTQKEKVQSDNPVSKTPGQKIIVTYISPDKPSKDVRANVRTDKRTGAYIQVPSVMESRETNASNRLKPTVTQSSSQSPSGQNPKIVPRISQPIRQVKKDDEEQRETSVASSSNASSTSDNKTNWPSIEEHESTLNNVVKRRGRPRKSTLMDTSSEIPKQDSKKPLTGPTLKRELDRQGHYSGRAKTTKTNDQQIKTVRHKRVSNTNPWTCALCGKVSFENSLGCLYGPYAEGGDVVKGDSDRGDVCEGGEPLSKKRRGSSEDSDQEELWFHGECLVWSPGVYALGESLAGYEQVVKDAQSRVRCVYRLSGII